MAQKVDIEDVAREAGVSLQDFEKLCCDRDLDDLAELCDPWELIGHHLGLDPSQLSAIKDDYRGHTELQRIRTLRKWKESLLRPTYRRLTEAFLKCGKINQALIVAKKLENRLTGEEQHAVDAAGKLDRSTNPSSADIASSLAVGVRYPVQASDDAQRDSPAKLKTKSPSAPQPLGAQAAQGQGGTTPPSERDIIRQKRLQRFSSDTSDKSDCSPVQGVVVERATSSGSVQSPLLSPSAAATDSTAGIPTLDSRRSGLQFEVGDMIQVDRPDSAPWYGVIRWMGTLPGSSIQIAGIDMENKVPGGDCGSLHGINYFNCPDGHGIFLPPSHLKRDSRFAEVDANTSDTPTMSSDQDSESSQPGRSASTPEDRLKNLFHQKLGMQDDTGAKQDSEDSRRKTFELQIPADRAGLVIGTGGKNVREVERLTNTSIDVDRARGSGRLGGENKRVSVLGSEENCKKALLMILKNVQKRVDEHTAGVKTITVPDSCVGRIIGKGGATISTIKSISGAQDIKFDDKKTGLEAMLQTERTCYIHGSEEAIEKAEKQIRLAMTGKDIVGDATFAAISTELLKMGVLCQEGRS